MDLFVTRVSDFQIPDIHLLSDHIIPHVLEEEETIERQGDAYSMRGKTGYHSKDNLCGIDAEWSENLKLVLHAMIQEHAANEGQAIPPAHLCRIACWAMIMRAGDHSVFHNHPNARYSGVLYLKVPPGLEKKEGELVFVDPRTQTRVGKYYDHHVFHRIHPVPGEGWVFPNWLDHYVEPHFCEGERISLSFNLIYM